MVDDTVDLPEPLSEKCLQDMANKMTFQPWGTGSRRADAIAYARLIIALRDAQWLAKLENSHGR